MRVSGKPFSGFAVDDLATASAFYGDVLGMTFTDSGDGLAWLHLGDDTRVLVYAKEDHAPATYTILNFPVSDIEGAVDELAGRGVAFERYDGMEQDDRGIMRGGGPLIAWFTDPAGNVLSLLQE